MVDSLHGQEIRRLRGENKHFLTVFSRFATVSRRVLSSLDFPRVLQDIVDSACELTRAQYGALAVLDASGNVQYFITHGLSPEERERIGAVPRGLGVLGLLKEGQRPVRLADLTKHPRAAGFPSHHPRMKTFLGTRIQLRGHLLGNLYLAEKKGQEFTQEDERLLAIFAAGAALTLHNARLFQAESAARARAEVAQRDLEAERQRLRTLIELVPVGVLMVDASREVFVVNHEARRILGASLQPGNRIEHYRQGLVFRRPKGDVYKSEDLPLERALRRGETVRAEEIWVEHSDKRVAVILASAVPLKSAGEKNFGALAAFLDITTIAELEKQRAESLSIISHELRKPLSIIYGLASLDLERGKPRDEAQVREFFELIRGETHHLSDLVSNISDMSFIETGALSVSLKPVDLRSVLEEAVKALAHLGGSQQVQVITPAGLPGVNIDRRRTLQVLESLLDNAIKFSPASAPITIEAEPGPTHVTVHVRDRGRGITSENLPRLFKKFSRVHDPRGADVPGSGLGLFICKGIVEAHGGRIWAQSPGDGKGATFSFTLPIATEAVAPALPAVTRRAQHQGRVRRAGERTRVLAVDDDPQLLRLLRRLLDEAGFKPVLTSDPAEAVKLVELEDVDLVLLDLKLPRVNGFELLQRIREFSGVPIIFLTASNTEEDAVRALQMGADDYVTKPFSASELVARIGTALRRRVFADQTEVRPPFVLGDLTIKFSERRVTRGGRTVVLSPTQYKLLYELATHAGRVLTHDHLLRGVWGDTYVGANELVRSMVRNLRRALGDDARRPQYILTEVRVGYRMPAPEDQAVQPPAQPAEPRMKD